MEHDKIELLFNLIDVKISARARTKILDEIETINGYDLVFVIATIIRYRFSGHLIVVNEQNELSGITFIYGEIIRIDYPDQENLLGNLVVQEELISQNEMEDILKQPASKKMGQYLLENGHLSSDQLANFLFKQSQSRLAKYIQDNKVRFNFNFDGESHEVAVVSNIKFYQILHTLIFNNFNSAWLREYVNFYSTRDFSINFSEEVYKNFKDLEFISEAFTNISHVGKKKLSYFELLAVASLEESHNIKFIHFMILTGFFVLLDKPTTDTKRSKSQQATPDVLSIDFTKVRGLIMTQNYFEAIGYINKSAAIVGSKDQVNFYFVWMKLHGSFHNNFLLDINKISKVFAAINPNMVGEGNYYYVKALLHASLKDIDACLAAYDKALQTESFYLKYPLIKNGRFYKNTGFFTTFKKLFGFN
ncbi:MAG: hypothetical protein AABY53_03120 [Bdellovibrionota bacterium]